MDAVSAETCRRVGTSPALQQEGKGKHPGGAGEMHFSAYAGRSPPRPTNGAHRQYPPPEGLGPVQILLCGLLLYLIDDNIVSFLLLLHLCNFDVAFLDLTKVRMLLSEHDSILHLECLHFFVVNFLFLLELDILILELLNLVSHGFIGIRFINALILLENI